MNGEVDVELKNKAMNRWSGKKGSVCHWRDGDSLNTRLMSAAWAFVHTHTSPLGPPPSSSTCLKSALHGESRNVGGFVCETATLWHTSHTTSRSKPWLLKRCHTRLCDSAKVEWMEMITVTGIYIYKKKDITMWGRTFAECKIAIFFLQDFVIKKKLLKTKVQCKRFPK